MTWWMWYLLNMTLTYLTFTAWDLWNYYWYCKELDTTSRYYQDRKARKLEEIKNEVPGKIFVSLIWPLCWSALVMYSLIKFFQWIVGKIAEKLGG